MILNACVIQVPNFQFQSFLPLCVKMLGYTPSKKADAAGLKDQPHLLSTLAAFENQEAVAGVRNAHLIYDIVPYSCLLVAYEQDMIFVLEGLSGMPFILNDTTARGIQIALVTGTLQQWRTSVTRWCRADQDKDMRSAFDKIYVAFQQIGLADAFGRGKKDLGDETFILLEGPR